MCIYIHLSVTGFTNLPQLIMRLLLLLLLTCLTICNPTDCTTPGFSVLRCLPESAQIESTWVGGHGEWFEKLSNHLVLCRSFLLLPSVFPSIKVFSSESTLCIRWPKYWSFSFSIGPSSEFSGLISFRVDWFDLLAFPGTLNSLL